MVNAVFAKMDSYLKYGNHETMDLMKLYGGNPPKSQNNSRSIKVAPQRILSRESSSMSNEAATENSSDVNAQVAKQNSGVSLKGTALPS